MSDTAFDRPASSYWLKKGCPRSRWTVARSRVICTSRRSPNKSASWIELRVRPAPSAASSNVRPVDDAPEAFVVGVVVAPDDVPADHAGLLFVAGVVGAVQREVAQRCELRL